MSERSILLKSIAETIYDYRAGEIPMATPGHVAKWISQFEGDVQVPLLKEIDHVLKQTYFDKDLVSDIFNERVKSENITGEKPHLGCGGTDAS